MKDQIPSERIRIDGGTQPRTSISDAIVADYADAMQGGAELPPIDIFFDGVNYWLADGFHRYHAAIRLGKDRIACELHNGTRRDAVLFSCGANAGHGLRRTNEDKRKAVMTLLSDEEWGKWSDHEISRRCGVHQTFVSGLHRSLKINISESSQRTYKTKHGTEATMQVENIGKKDRTREGVARRRQDVADMAGRGFSRRQIASALNLSVDRVVFIAKEAGVTIHADRVLGKSKRHDSTRIIESMVMDAEHLTADVGLIEFSDLDRASFSVWVASLESSRDKLSAFIRQLKKEQQKHGEAA